MPEQSLPTGAVFLSYASQDAEAAARICEGLRAAGVEVWFDRNELRGGDAWDAQIKKQIHDCALFVPLISAHTNARTEGYFRREWKLATRRLLDIADDAAFLVPVVIDDTREVHARVPEEFTSVQWTRLSGGAMPPEFVQHVRQLLSRDLVAESTGREATKPLHTGPASTRRHRQSHRRLVGAAVAPLVLMALGGALWWYYQGANDAPGANPAATATSPVAAAAPHEKSIAVLPFVNMSSDKEQEYFSDGLSEELLNLLAKIPELRVSARTSSFYFKGKDVKLTDVARELQVAHVLEGSVRKSGDRVRVTAQLVRASDGYHEWSETYDQTLEDIFTVQEEIAAAVVSELKVTLLGSPVKVRKTTTPEAYTLYLQAMQLDRLGANRFDESIALYQRVLAIDPNYTPAWLGLGANYFLQADYGVVPLAEGMEKARATMHKLLAVDPEYALGHAGLGSIALHFDHDLAASARHFERALALNPTDLYTLYIASFLNQALGRLENDVLLAEYLVSRDPMDPNYHANLGHSYLYAGRLDDAIASLRAALKLSPAITSVHQLLGQTFLLKGDFDAALGEYKKEPTEAQRLMGLAITHYAMGHKPEADAALKALIDKHDDWPSQIACVFAFRGKKDRAFEWLDRAAVIRDSALTHLPISPFLKNLHDDPRWMPLLRTLGKAPEQLALIKFELKVPQY